MLQNLILGTAQLGQMYGIANISGKPDQQEAQAIVQAALDGGIAFFDTAQGYGDSETVLGKALRQCKGTGIARIITKLAPTLPVTAEALHASAMQSIAALGVQQLYCLMLHREEQIPLLDAWQGDVLEKLLHQGQILHIGVSVYTPEAALCALSHQRVSVVQIPASLFDRRFEAAGVFEAARKLGKELHIRSVFLQGILGMAPEQLPSALVGLAQTLSSLRQLAHDSGCSQLQAALGWMLQRYPGARILFGAEQEAQVLQNIEFACKNASLPSSLWERLDLIYPKQIPELLNPAQWKR